MGKYDTTVTLNAATDARLEPLAQNQTFLGTWDDLRYPSIYVELHRQQFLSDPGLTASVIAADVGDAIGIRNLPVWIGNHDTETLIQGYDEILANRGWTIDYATSPYGPYRANDLVDTSVTAYRVAASNSSLNAAINSTTTSFVVKTPLGAKWGNSTDKPGNFPISIVVNGEQMTVGAISAPSGDNQTFSSVTRSVNGIIRTHGTNDVVQVARPFRAVF